MMAPGRIQDDHSIALGETPTLPRSLFRELPDTNLAKLDLAALVVHLQQDAALLVAILGVATVGGGLVVDPGLQVVADRADPHPDPLAILRPGLRLSLIHI